MSAEMVAGLVLMMAPQAGGEPDPCRTVVVYLEGNTPVHGSFKRATQTVEEIFASAGVEIRWAKPVYPRSRGNGCGLPVYVEFTTGAPEGFRRGSLAYAMPYHNEGPGVTILWDRVRRVSRGNLGFEGALLAHVMAHEITHFIQGVARHSSSGLMREAWNPSDHATMREGWLPFTDGDITLLRMGLDWRLASARRSAPKQLRTQKE